jgi:hypothetical protein
MAPAGGMWSAADLGSVLLVHVRTSRCALCDDDGAVVVHEGHLIGCGYFQEFLDGANNLDFRSYAAAFSQARRMTLPAGDRG